jgi:hypothetical protein
MISTIEKPFSYIVPLNRFPSKTIVYDIEKKIKVVNEVSKRNHTERIHGYTHRKRNMGWRNDQAATLYYVEALDGEIQKTK